MRTRQSGTRSVAATAYTLWLAARSSARARQRAEAPAGRRGGGDVDAWLVAAVGAELEALCRGGRVDRVGQPRPSDLVLQIHSPRGGHHLLLSADPGLNRVHFLPSRPANPATPPAFCQLLRRHVEGARLAACRQSGLERVLELHLAARDELGNARPLRLIVELTGRLANIILVGPDGRVLDALRRVSEEVNRHREVLPGLPYVPPPRPTARVDPVLALAAGGPEGLRAELLPALGARDPQEPAAARLAAAVFGLTPALAAALAAWAGGSPGGPSPEGATGPKPPPVAPRPGADSHDAGLVRNGEPGVGADGHGVAGAAGMPRSAPPQPTIPCRDPGDEALAAAVAGLARSISEGRFRPCVLETPRGPVPSAWPLPGWEAEPAPSASDACAQAYGRLAAARQADALRQRLAAALRAARERTARRIAKQEEEWTRAEDCDHLRVAGELLLAYGHLVARGAAEAWLPSFEDPERQVRVALDPALAPAANAQRLLRAYRKERRAREEVSARLQASRDEGRYLEETTLALEHAEDARDLAALEAEMAAQGLLRERGPGGASGSARRPAPLRGKGATAGGVARPVPAPPLRFAADAGWVILVGRSAGSNDHLTMHMARPDDVWLHARQIPGSHVLLQPPADGPGRGEPPGTAILQAARCAAHFSAGRTAAHTAVDFTLRRHVSKPAGARPGFVLYRNERTLVVEPADLPPRTEAIGPGGSPAAESAQAPAR